jgi:hypothetical protein
MAVAAAVTAAAAVVEVKVAVARAAAVTARVAAEMSPAGAIAQGVIVLGRFAPGVTAPRAGATQP